MSKELTLVQEDVSRFDELKLRGDKIITSLKAIKVTDATSMAIAEQKLREAKEYRGEVEKIRVLVKAPFIQIGKQIDQKAKELDTPIDPEYDRLEKETLAYKQEQKRLADEKAKKALEIQNKIIAYQSESIVEINNCKTVAELGEIFKKRIGKENSAFPGKEVWGEFMADATLMLEVIREHGKLRRKQIEDLAKIPEEKKAEVIIEQQKESAENYVKTAEPVLKASTEAINEAKAVKQTGIRKDWTFAMVSRADVPERFLIIDETKVREYMRQEVKEGRFEAGKEYTQFGFKFKQEESLSVR